MQELVRLERGHKDLLLQPLDGDREGVESPGLAPPSGDLVPQVERAALGCLRRLDLPIEARKQWPTLGRLKRCGVQCTIPADQRARPGMTLCLWGDGGWEQIVRAGKQQDGRIQDEHVGAFALLARRWSPAPQPRWGTYIPSLPNPRLVTEVAQRLAAVLGLPIHIGLEQTSPRGKLESMAKSAQQARNVDGSLAIYRRPRPSPRLLVDDVVGSRSTFAVAAWLLRRRGSGEVWPLALSSLGGSQ